MHLSRLTLPAMVALILLAPAASAHSTEYNTGIADGYQIAFSYGNLYEPVSTFQKTGLDLGIRDAHGNPITGLQGVDVAGKPLPDPPIRVELVFGEQVLDLTPGFVQQIDRPGWYTYPIIYTKIGAYRLHIIGMVNGTHLDINIQPSHAITDGTTNMWPSKIGGEDAQAAEIAKLKADLATLQATVDSLADSKKAPGFDVSALLLGLIGLVSLAGMRRGRIA